MHRYQVRAIRSQSGQEEMIEVMAASEQEAIQQAAERGLDAQEVRLLEEEAAGAASAAASSAGAGGTPEDSEGTTDTPGAYDDFPLVKVTDGLLAQARSLLSESLIEWLSRMAMLVGLWAMVGFAGLMLIAGIVVAIDIDSIDPFGISLAKAVLGLALLYTAAKFGHTGVMLIRSSPSSLSGRFFLNSVALIGLVLAVVFLIGGIAIGIREGAITHVWEGLVGAVFLALIAGLALSPALVNCGIQKGASAGREFLGILAFIAKSVLRIVPVIFGAAVSIGTVLLVIELIRYLAADDVDKVDRLVGMMALGVGILVAAALPLLVYLLATLYYLLIELASAILSLPQKLDQLRR